jgi:DNA modification methylase
MYDINEIRNQVLCGNSLEILKEIPTESVHMCVTSPPYWTLRSYKTEPYIWGGDPNCNHQWGVEVDTPPKRKKSENKIYGKHCTKCSAWRGELGSEPTPHLYISHLIEIFSEIKRILRNDGTVWVVIGDCYTPQSSHKGGTQYDKFKKTSNWIERSETKDTIPSWGKPKDLVGIPWRFAFAMQDSGWLLRNDIIWQKPNPLPSPSIDRCVSSHEHCFLFAKSFKNTFWTHRDKSGTRKKPNPDYRYYDTLTDTETETEPPHWKTEIIEETGTRRWKRYNLWSGHAYYFDHIAIREPVTTTNITTDIKYGGTKYPGNCNNTYSGNDYIPTGMRNKRDVWKISTDSCRDSHFAVYPKKLIEPMIFAGTSENGVCSICGAPHTRVTRKTEPNEEWKKQCGADNSGNYRGESVKEYESAKAQNASDVKRRILDGMLNVETIRWEPSCDCKNAGINRPIVLDPFYGAGTTGIVTNLYNRDYIGIEINRDFIEIAKNRLPREIEKEKIKLTKLKTKTQNPSKTKTSHENPSPMGGISTLFDFYEKQ